MSSVFSSSQPVSRRRALGLLGGACLVAAAGCGGDPDPEPEPTGPGEPVATETAASGASVTRYAQGGALSAALPQLLGIDGSGALLVRTSRFQSESLSLVGLVRVSPDGTQAEAVPQTTYDLIVSRGGRTAVGRIAPAPGGTTPLLQGQLTRFPLGAGGAPEAIDITGLPAGFTAPGVYAVNDAGAICFGAYNPEALEQAVFLRPSPGAAPVRVARVGGDVAVSGDRVGSVVASDVSGFALNAAGDLIFFASDRNGGSRLFFVPAGAAEGDPAAEIAATAAVGGTVQSFLGAAINDAGAVAYVAKRVPDGTPLLRRRAPQGGEGAGAEDFPSGTISLSPGGLSLNGRGDVACVVGLSASAPGEARQAVCVFPGGGGEARLVLQTGEPLFGRQLDFLHEPVLDDAGRIGVRYYLRNPPGVPGGGSDIEGGFAVVTPAGV